MTSITRGTATVVLAYDNADRRTTLTYPNGIVAAYTYDTANRVAPMIDVEIGTDNYELHDIRIDGNRYNRTRTLDCAYPNGSNMLAKGRDFRIVGVESVRAMCGSGMEVYTNDVNTGFEIYNSTFADNGSEAGSTPNNAVSDGLTLGRCGTGYVEFPGFSGDGVSLSSEPLQTAPD